MRRARQLISINFLLAIAVALAFYGWLVATGLAETDPNILRANRMPLGAAFLALVEIALLVLYLRRHDLTGLARVLAVLLGVIGLIQTTVIPLLDQQLYGAACPTPTHMLLWYVYGSHVLFGAGGSALGRSSSPVEAGQPS
jgi:hypothetical protein